MSEFAPKNFDQTPDDILKSRTLSDADLLSDGADYENGVLKPTAEQIETIRHRYDTKLGRVGMDLSGVVLHTEGVSDLNYLSNEAALQNEARLSAEVHDLTSRYVDMMRIHFPEKINRFKNEASSFLQTTQTERGDTVNYSLGFHSIKSELEGGERVAKPSSVAVSMDKYGHDYRTEYGTKNRDVASYHMDQNGGISLIDLSTLPVGPDTAYIHQLDRNTSGKFNEGIVPELVKMIDDAPFPETQVYDKSYFDSAYHASIKMHGNEYAITFSRYVKRQITHARHVRTEEVTYGYDPQRDCFMKSTDSTWDIGPKEIETTTFMSVVRKALGNIPTVET